MSLICPREGVCAWCTFWHVDAPEGWKPKSYDEDAEPELYDWREWARKKHDDEDALVDWPVLTGMCSADPTRVQTKGAHGCSRYIDKSLPDPTTLADRLCGRTWFDSRLRDIQKKNEKLKRQVAHHKKLAVSRLKRLEAIGGSS